MGRTYVEGIWLTEDEKSDTKGFDVKGAAIIGYELIFAKFEN